MDIAIIDYKMSNLHSVQSACNKVGLTSIITSDIGQILDAKIAILPGVGAFGEAMTQLVKSKLDECIYRFIETGRPFIGICLGLQLLSLAAGMKTRKMNHGHHGANHPVKNLEDETVLITSQNHGFCIDESELPDRIRVTHRSLFDHTIQGIHMVDRPAFGFQGHPEASPGPHDASPLFDHFIDLMRERS